MDGEAAVKRGINETGNAPVISFGNDEIERTTMNIGGEMVLENSNMLMMQPDEKTVFTSADEGLRSLMNLVDEKVKSKNDVVRPEIDVASSANGITGSTDEELESLRVQIDGFAGESCPDLESIMKEGLCRFNHR